MTGPPGDQRSSAGYATQVLPSALVATATRWSLLPELASSISGEDHLSPLYVMAWTFQAPGRSFMPESSSRGTQRRRNRRGVPDGSIVICGISYESANWSLIASSMEPVGVQRCPPANTATPIFWV